MKVQSEARYPAAASNSHSWKGETGGFWGIVTLTGILSCLGLFALVYRQTSEGSIYFEVFVPRPVALGLMILVPPAPSLTVGDEGANMKMPRTG